MPYSITAADRQLLLEIMETNDPEQLAKLLHAYYQDLDRADRTPRPQLYRHLGMLTGAVMRVLNERRPPAPGPEPAPTTKDGDTVIWGSDAEE